MVKTHTLIIGGGISGLSYAEAIAGRDYLICEALSDVGGYCQTVKQDGFIWDYSGHFFHFRHKEIEDHLVSRIGRERVRTVVKDSRIHFKGAWIDFPFQRNIHQLPREDFLDCLVDLFERPTSSAAPANFKEMLFAKFGKGICERFLFPYNEKLYATDLSHLDVDAMGRFFPHANAEEIVRGFRGTNNQSYNATFTYPEGGAIEYVRATQQGVDAHRILLNERVQTIDPAKKIATTNNREIAFEQVVSCAPFPKLLQITGTPHDPSLYTYNKVLVFNLGFSQKGPKGLHWIYYPERDLSFYRVGFYDNIFDSARMSLYVELGYPRDALIDAAEVERMRQRVLEDLRRVGLVTSQELVSWHHVVLDPAYVHITEQSNADVKAKKAQLAAQGIHSIGRYGSWTYCSIEDNIVEARELAKQLA
ncbi:MAG TPA: FAD-dependent oxidoreductase [Polyangiaceae bacterium]|jgi:protoporphyrinogen oxidase|nr:FAD-dependent oxidoreductase [Polyangiaceae bacterium]